MNLKLGIIVAAGVLLVAATAYAKKKGKTLTQVVVEVFPTDPRPAVVICGATNTNTGETATGPFADQGDCP